MNKTSANLSFEIKKLQTEFWRHAQRLFALRATISMTLLSVPFIVAGQSFFGVTLLLGALAGALSETDDHPKGRLKSLSITIISFFLSSFAVGFLHNYPIIYGVGFIGSTIVFIIIGGISERYRAITFGSILIGIYAMLGIDQSPAWYWHSILLPVGALFHGLLSLFLMYRKPYRLLDEQLAQGYINLSKFMEKKAALFPSNKDQEEIISKDLALLNINVVTSLEKIKEVLNNFGKELKDQELLRPYLQRFMLLQSLHERAASSHERYEKLSEDQGILDVMAGLGELLRQLAYATRQLAQSMLVGETYRHPVTIDWLVKALDDRLQQMDSENTQALMLVHHNLSRSHSSLKYLDDVEKGTAIPRLQKDERTASERIRAQLSFKHPRMRYAIRLSISFLIGFIIAQKFSLDKGAWIMLTSLFVSQITYIDTRRRLFQRILGTALGVVAGVLLILVFNTIAAQVIFMLLSALAFFYWVRSNYSVAVFFITTFVLFAFNLIAGDGGIQLMLPRLAYTLLGALTSFMVIRLLWPGWQQNRIPQIISTAMTKNAAYLNAIVHEYSQTEADDLAYRIARREAHKANNELTQAWNSMRLEPKNKRTLMQHAFTLTYLNNVLLSYISALGAHRETNNLTTENTAHITRQVSNALIQSSEFFEKPNDIRTDLAPLIIELKQKVNTIEAGFTRRQFRLFYSIAGITNKIMKEMRSIQLMNNDI